MDKDVQDFISHDIYEIVPHMPGMRTVRIGGVLHWKFKNGIFEKNKARLVTRENHQEPGIDLYNAFLSLESPRTSRRSGLM